MAVAKQRTRSAADVADHPPSISESTLAVMVATLASMTLGFFREVVNARYFGEAWEMDSYLVAAIIPTLAFGVFQGALVSALVPVFSKYFADGEDEQAWRLSSTVINVLLIVLSVGAAACIVLAPVIVHLVAAGFPAGKAAETVDMTRILMPTIVATSIAGVITALLNAQQRFKAASLQGVALNICTIAAVLLLNKHFGIFALVFGATAGLVAQLLVQLPNYLRRCKYVPVIDLNHPGLRMLGGMLAPIVVGSAVGQINLLFDNYFASGLENGNIATMNYATKLVGFPQQLFAAAIATVIFPVLAQQFAVNDIDRLRQTASTGLRITGLITVPAAVALIVFARPIISVLFERGEFSHPDLIRTAGTMQCYALGLVGIAASIVLTRCFFAMHDARTPVAVAAFAMALNVACSALSVRHFGVNGLALSNALASTVEAVVLYFVLRARIGEAPGEPLLPAFARTLLASALMAAAAGGVFVALWHDGGSYVQHALTLAVALLVAGGVFVGFGTLLRIRELALLMEIGADYVRRRAAVAAGS